MHLGDFYIHSNFSNGKRSIPEIVDIYGSRGFGAIAITDQVSSTYLGRTLTEATFPLYREILRSEAVRAWDQYGMRVIPGLELIRRSVWSSRSTHVLALGVNDLIFPEGNPTEWVEKIRTLGGVAIAAQPVWKRTTFSCEKQTDVILGAIRRHEERATVTDGNFIFGRGLANGYWRYALGNLVRA